MSARENVRADVELIRSRVPRPFTSSLPVERQGTRRGTHPRQTCIRCGGHSHPREPCPAKDVTCHRCQKRGHYSSKCLTKVRISELTQDQSLDSAFLGTVDPQPSTTVWYITLSVNGHDTQFKINMGAEVTAVSEETYQRLKSPQISTPRKTLYGPSQCQLITLGQFSGTLSYQGKSTLQTVFVVSGLKTNLLGMSAITSLTLATRIDSTETGVGQQDYRNMFPDLYYRLEKFGSTLRHSVEGRNHSTLCVYFKSCSIATTRKS